MKQKHVQHVFNAVVLGLVAIMCTAADSFGREPLDPAKNYAGINVWFLNDYNGNNVFVDIIKSARRWRNYAWNADPVLDADGWPTTDCSSVIFGPGNQLGVYKLFFTGRASSVSMLWVSGSVSNLQYNTTTNTSTADVTLNAAQVGGIRFQNTQRTAASATNTGVTNIRLYRPGYPTDGSVVYTNEWRALMGRFQVVRFMDWVYTNKNPIKTWAQRRRPGTGSYGDITVDGRTGSRGHVLEDFIRLCNDVDADLWLNIPVFADDDYVTKCAQAILYGTDGVNPYTSPQASPVFPPLGAHLKVYLEYANEFWNSAAGFQCYHWIKQKSDSVIANTTQPHPIVYDGNREQYTAVARWTAWKQAEHGLLFRQVFGDGAMMTRVRPVLMGQLGGNWSYPRQLPFLDGYYATARTAGDPYPNTNPRPVSYYLYGSGGSSYYGVNTWSTDANTFFNASNYPTDRYTSSMTADAIWAGNFGLKRIAYEGGMGLDNSTWGATEEQKRAINADTRMKTLTQVYHDTWSRFGGDLLVYYEAAGSVNWEFTPNPSITNSSKLLAIDAIRDSMPRAQVDLGGIAPRTLDCVAMRAASQIASTGNYFNGTSGGQTVIGGCDPGEWLAFPIGSTDDGWYTISARCAATSSTISLWLNGVQVATRTLSGNTLGFTAPVSVQFKRGLNVIRYQPVTGGSSLHSIAVERDTTVGVSRNNTVSTAGHSVLNLFTGAGMIQLRVPVSNVARLELFTVEGRRVARAEVRTGGASVSLPQLSAGTYVLKVVGADKREWHGTYLVSSAHR